MRAGARLERALAGGARGRPGGASCSANRIFPREYYPGDGRELAVQVRGALLHDDADRHGHVVAPAAQPRAEPPRAAGGASATSRSHAAQAGHRHDRRLQREAALRLLRLGLQQGAARAPTWTCPSTSPRWRTTGRSSRTPSELVNCSIGEPFMMKNVDELLDAFGSRGKVLELTTNGQILTDANIAQAAGPQRPPLHLARRGHARDLRQAAQRHVREAARQRAPAGAGQGRAGAAAARLPRVHADEGERARGGRVRGAGGGAGRRPAGAAAAQRLRGRRAEVGPRGLPLRLPEGAAAVRRAGAHQRPRGRAVPASRRRAVGPDRLRRRRCAAQFADEFEAGRREAARGRRRTTPAHGIRARGTAHGSTGTRNGAPASRLRRRSARSGCRPAPSPGRASTSCAAGTHAVLLRRAARSRPWPTSRRPGTRR